MSAPSLVRASVPVSEMPPWAVLQRQLFATLDASLAPFLDRYTLPDGTLIWRDATGGRYPSRDGADDFYESFGNWPQYYLLGGGDHLLHHSHRMWEAVTRQLASYGLVEREYEVGYDQFHQAESYITFYALCMADPGRGLLRRRAARFARMFTGDDPQAENYDAERQLIRAPHNGSRGPRDGFFDGEPAYRWSAGMRQYGLPFLDVPGIDSYDDLRDPALARRMGEAMQQRMGRGDVAANLCVTSLVTNAYLLTGEQRYADWVVEYVDAWGQRAAANGGLLPDNLGLSGKVGEYIDGKWYGGLYGWSWPHGYYNIGYAAVVAATSAFLVSGEQRFLELPRRQFDAVWEQGKMLPVADQQMSLASHFAGQLGDGTDFLVPYRHSDAGWFDYQPMSARVAATLWNITESDQDWQRLAAIRERSSRDWARVVATRGKEDADHDRPWLAYLAGDFADYPAVALGVAHAMACRRLTQVLSDDADLTEVHIHHWQDANPVTTEALVQLTTGSPQPIYNGGLLHSRLRYYDALARRPGLPQDVAALVSAVGGRRVTLQLVNTSGFHDRVLLLQAGGFREHRLRSVQLVARRSDYPGPISNRPPPPVATELQTLEVDGPYLEVALPAATELRLELTMDRYCGTPTYATPWDY